MPIPTPATDAGLRRALLDYARRWPQENDATACLQLLDAGDNPFVRERVAGHFTASAWLVSADGSRLLMTHHRKLGMWLQLGGHADGERDLSLVALQEAEEESGLTGLRLDPTIFDVDIHWIPEHRQVTGHWHYDVRYVVHAEGGDAFVVSEESHDLAWRDIGDLAEDEEIDASVRRMARKWLAR